MEAEISQRAPFNKIYYSAVGQPLWLERGGQSYFSHADHHGSVLALTDKTGAAVNAYDYDAFVCL